MLIQHKEMGSAHNKYKLMLKIYFCKSAVLFFAMDLKSLILTHHASLPNLSIFKRRAPVAFT